MQTYAWVSSCTRNVLAWNMFMNNVHAFSFSAPCKWKPLWSLILKVTSDCPGDWSSFLRCSRNCFSSILSSHIKDLKLLFFTYFHLKNPGYLKDITFIYNSIAICIQFLIYNWILKKTSFTKVMSLDISNVVVMEILPVAQYFNYYAKRHRRTHPAPWHHHIIKRKVMAKSLCYCDHSLGVHIHI